MERIKTIPFAYASSAKMFTNKHNEKATIFWARFSETHHA